MKKIVLGAMAVVPLVAVPAECSSSQPGGDPVPGILELIRVNGRHPDF